MAVYTLLCWMRRPARHTFNYKYTVQCNKLTRRYSRNTEERPTFNLPQLGKMLKSGWSKRLTPTQWSVDCKMRVFWFERQSLLCDQVSKHREMMNLAVSIIPMQSQPLSQLFLRNPLSSRQSQTFLYDIIFASNKVRKPVCLFILSSPPAGGALTATLSSSLKTNSHSWNITERNQSWLWIHFSVRPSLNTRKLSSPLFASTMPDRSRAWGQNRSRVVKADPA